MKSTAGSTEEVKAGLISHPEEVKAGLTSHLVG